VRDGLAASAQIGDRYYLPRDFNALAELGRSRDWRQKRKHHTGVPKRSWKGMLSRAPGRYAQASLLSAVAEMYAGHFRVPAALGHVDEAYQCSSEWGAEQIKVRQRASLQLFAIVELLKPRDVASQR
jgi:hypothetical protein